MLEHALRQERLKGAPSGAGAAPSGMGVFPPASSFSAATLPSQLNTLMGKNTLRSKAPGRGSAILKRFAALWRGY
jgi:hypothetical protein